MDKGRGKKVTAERSRVHLWHCLMRKYDSCWITLLMQSRQSVSVRFCLGFFLGGPSRRGKHGRWVLVYAAPRTSVTDGCCFARRTKGMWQMQSFCKQHVLHAFLLYLCWCSSRLFIEQRFSQQNVSINLYLHHCCGCGSCIPHKIALMVKLNFWPAIQL